MSPRPLLPVFTASLFISAFLVFAVQPMTGRMLLPLLGGGASVWNTAIVFFQAMLLAGYAYAQLIARFLPIKLQAVLHILLLTIFALVLPVSISENIYPPENGGQAAWQLGVMLAGIGGPFFVLAASVPLLQHWLDISDHEDTENPYSLYAVITAGSVLSLLIYPIVIEPLMGLRQQAAVWAGGYGLFVVLSVCCAWLVWNRPRKLPPLAAGYDRRPIGWAQRLVWIALAFIPSSLMLGVTTTITTDLASASLLWVLPLAAYILTIFIAFSRQPLVSLNMARALSAFALPLVLLMLMVCSGNTTILPVIAVHLGAFFLFALLCHSELARARPSPFHLTEYFLFISVGTILGGAFNALIAPVAFKVPMEYSIALAMVGFVIWIGSVSVPYISGAFNALDDRNRAKRIIGADLLALAMGLGICLATFAASNALHQILGAIAVFVFLIMTTQHRFVFAVTACAAFLMFQPGLWNSDKKLLSAYRNYYGAVKVFASQDAHYVLQGTTLHGAQYLRKDWRTEPTTYYSRGGPASDAFDILTKYGASQKVGVLGLGAGSIACYQARNRYFDVYEIDSDVVRIAQEPKYFTYLSDCGTDHNIIPGDGRRNIGQAQDGSYGMLFLDSFSSGNIPAHLMTREAFESYLPKLAPGGFIVMNISNRYFDLRPELAAIARDLGLTVYFRTHKAETMRGDVSELHTSSSYAVLARDGVTVAHFVEDKGWKPYERNLPERAWTDDYANILRSWRALP